MTDVHVPAGRLIVGALFWASIPLSIILSSWAPFGIGLLILVLMPFVRIGWNQVHRSRVDKSIDNVITGTWSNPGDHPKAPPVA